MGTWEISLKNVPRSLRQVGYTKENAKKVPQKIMNSVELFLLKSRRCPTARRHAYAGAVEAILPTKATRLATLTVVNTPPLRSEDTVPLLDHLLESGGGDPDEPG